MLILVVAGFSKANAQHWPGVVQNIELGYGWAQTWGNYIRHDKIVREDGRVYDTTISQMHTSKSGFAGTVGTSLPLKRLGRISSLQLGVDFIYSAYKWDYPVPTSIALTDTGMAYQYDPKKHYTGSVASTALALSADFKFGVDAMRDKSLRWGWTGGIGVIPSMNLSTDIANVESTFGVQPFVKSEVSMRAGIVWKLRVMYTMGSVDYYKYSGKVFGADNSSTETSFQSKGSLSVSLLMLPFSFTYNKSDWFNSF
jgi:hypothetical protein